MPEKNDLILAQLQQQYGLVIVELTLLPLGADPNATIYRAVAADSALYFVKLKRGAFDPLAPMVATFLREQGMNSIIAPRVTLTGQQWATLEDSLTLLVYPFIEGHNGYEQDVSDSQ